MYVTSREDDRIIKIAFREIVLIKIGAGVSDGCMGLAEIPVKGFMYIVSTLIEVGVAIKFPIDFLWVPVFSCVDILLLDAIFPPSYHFTTNCCPATIRKLKGVVPATLYADAFRPILNPLCFY